MASMTATGETLFVGLNCLPGYVSAIWASNDMPELVFDVNDQEAGESEAFQESQAEVSEPDDLEPFLERPAAVTDEEWEQSGERATETADD